MTAVVNQILDDQTPGEVDEDDASDNEENLHLDEEPRSTVLAFDVICGKRTHTITDINVADDPKAKPM